MSEAQVDALQEQLAADLTACAASAYPDECCGLIERRDGDGRVRLLVHPARNLCGATADRADSGRSSRTGFWLDPGDHVRLMREARAAGGEIVAVYHSHPDGGSAMSSEDRRAAAPGGHPSDKALCHLILGVTRSAVRSWALHRWDLDAREYVELDIITGLSGRSWACDVSRFCSRWSSQAPVVPASVPTPGPAGRRAEGSDRGLRDRRAHGADTP